MGPHNRLVNVPQPELFESASCWLSRLALSQGASLNDLSEYFGLSRDADLDQSLRGELLSNLRRLCGLSDAALFVHERIVSSLDTMSPAAEKYLIRGRNKAGFRYCPLCIKEMRTPHFPIHWRFIAWRWCPVHDCLLEDACHQCGKEPTLPIDIAASKAGRLGYALLNRCGECAARLSDVIPCHLQEGDLRRVSDREDLILANGRALLAALYHGWFHIKGRSARMDLGQIQKVERHGALAVCLTWLATADVRARNFDQGHPRQASATSLHP